MSELHNCIQSVHKGTPYFSLWFLIAIFNDEVAPQIQKMKLLSASERTIVKFVAEGKSTKEIAELLSLSMRTIDKHRSNIIAKLGLVKEKDILTNWAKENIDFVNY